MMDEDLRVDVSAKGRGQLPTRARNSLVV